MSPWSRRRALVAVPIAAALLGLVAAQSGVASALGGWLFADSGPTVVEQAASLPTGTEPQTPVSVVDLSTPSEEPAAPEESGPPANPPTPVTTPIVGIPKKTVVLKTTAPRRVGASSAPVVRRTTTARKPAVAPKPKPTTAPKPTTKPITTASTPTTTTRKATTTAPVAASGEAGEVVRLTNEQRQAKGCPALTVNAALTRSASLHSADMAAHNYFSHTGLDGRSPFDRMTAAGYRYRMAAENIAAGQPTPAQVMQGWMNSAGHRANILNCALTEIGVGVAKGGSYGIYWTQNFGTPR